MRIGMFSGQKYSDLRFLNKRVLKFFANIDKFPPGEIRDKAMSIYNYWANGKRLTRAQKEWLIVNKVAIDMERKEG